jgi:hypothetical protein
VVAIYFVLDPVNALSVQCKLRVLLPSSFSHANQLDVADSAAAAAP